jgi:hypothetical protein
MKNWKATREVSMRKLIQAKRVRCLECVKIVKLWWKNFGYGPERFMLPEMPARTSTVRGS